MKNKKKIFLIALFSILFCGWGTVGHKIINTKTVVSFPSQMSDFVSWSTYLADHASDADKRKNSDPNESPKHYIDIDEYSEFNNSGRIIQDYDSIVTKYGSGTVIDIGILPWAIINTYDSLKAQFSRRDWNTAKQTAADLGHYVGDSHMPLHITKNYNGQYTGQYGVHSRYETTMIGKYENIINYTPDSAEYISDIPDFVFTYIYGNYTYVDSVLDADKTAESYAGGSTSSDTYYQKLWELTGNFTIHLFSKASSRLASLIYTAWVNAGSPDFTISAVNNISSAPKDFRLSQNYPNPFNPSTTISYNLPKEENVVLKLYNTLGQEVKTLINNRQSSGQHSFSFTAENLTSGIYLYRLSAGNQVETKKMILIK